MKDKIEFYVGILLKDRERIMQSINLLNEDTDPKFHVFIKGEYDDPDGYYNLVINGTWEAYKCFQDDSNKNGYIKSLNHYEE